MKPFLAISLLFLTFLVSTAFAGDRVVARVGSEPITESELTDVLGQDPGLTRQKALELLIERRLVLVWAMEKNISVRDEELERVVADIMAKNNLNRSQFEEALESRGQSIDLFMANLREQLTINKALGMAMSEGTRISDAELQELYLSTYPRKTVFEVSHILLSVDKEAPAGEDSAARSKAEQILAEISSGASFESMAAQYSQDGSSAQEGGRLGTFAEGELLPELEALARTLQPGEAGGPARTSAGYHIILLVSKELSEPPAFAEVRSTLERSLLAGREESFKIRWLEGLKETTYIEVFPDDG